MPRFASIAVVLAAALLTGCDMLDSALGIESPEKIAAAREADGKAIGGACRHAGRAIEDCFVLNRKADKAAMFAGWRDMNDYMRENKIDPIAPQLTTQMARVGAKMSAGDAADESGSDASSDKPARQPADAVKSRGREAGKAHDS